MAQPITTPWAQIEGSMRPLIPAPVAPPVFAPVPDGGMPSLPETASPRVMYEPQGDFSDAPKLQKIEAPSKAPKVFASVPDQANVQLIADPMERIIGHKQNQLEAFERKDANPFGSANNHPGFGGKLAHVFSKIGNIAGDIVAPGVMARVPGTDLNRQMEESGLERNIQGLEGDEAKNALEGAQAQEAGALAKKADEPDFTAVPTAEGYMSFDPHAQNPQLNPLPANNGQPVMPYVKPGPRQHVFLAGPNNMPIAATFDPQSGTYYDAHGTPVQNPQPYEKAPAETPHAINIDGKPGFGVVVPGKGWVDPMTGQPITGHVTPIPPPPSYGQLILPTKTATFIDPKTGLPVEMQWNEKTQTYDKPLGLSASNAYGHEAAQAGAVDRAATDLIAQIEAHKDKLGNPSAIIQSAILGTPWADRQTAKLRSQIATFAALQPSMHGFRGQDAMRQFEKILGGIPNNPDALIASINGITRTAGAINPGLANRHSEPQRPANVPANYAYNAHGPKGAGWYAPKAR